MARELLLRTGYNRTMSSRYALVGILVATIFLLSACMAGAYRESATEQAPFDVVGDEPLPAVAGEALALEDAGRSMQLASAPTTVPEREESQTRQRVFSADLQLRVASVEQTRNELLSMVQRIDGYVESSQADFLVLRVPAELFDDSLSSIVELGELISRSIETADVTDQFVDMERRLTIARVSRERLYELLERTTDSQEQVAILREIRRLTEEIEALNSRLDALASLVAYSRITVRLVPRLSGDDILIGEIPFPWIAALDPLVPTIGRARARFDGALPADFAVFETGRTVSAESADGVRVRAGGIENSPRGDAAFWQRALEFHRGPLYADVDSLAIGPFLGIEFESRDREPFFFWVMAAATDRELLVIEVFFPSADARGRHRAAVESWVEEVSP